MAFRGLRITPRGPLRAPKEDRESPKEGRKEGSNAAGGPAPVHLISLRSAGGAAQAREYSQVSNPEP
eukprot:2520586-Pyramimonas_sp.AAC.1